MNEERQMIMDKDYEEFCDKIGELFDKQFGRVIPEDLETVSTNTSKAPISLAKKKGSEHYKTGGVEPIDLYKAGGMLRHFALCNIIKYAFRNRNLINPKDMDKIIHYAEILKGS